MSNPVPRVRVTGPIKSRSWTRETGVVERIEERLLIRDLVRIIFFVPRDNFDIASGVSHALDSYVRAIKGSPRALSRYTCCHWEPSRLDDRGWELIREALTPGERRYFEDYTPDEAFYPEKDGADPYFRIDADDDSGYSFSYHARIPSREPPPNSVSVLRVTLPTEYLEERGAGFVRELALDMASRLPFASGHAGLALDVAYDRFDRLDMLRPLLSRHPGFDIRDANIHDHMGSRVDGVHWLNFLGPPVLAALGGAAGLRSLLQSPSTTVRELEGERVLVSLGPEPDAGDLSLGRMLPEYRELARVLEPWQEPFAWGFLRRQNRLDDEQALRHWWRRFLD